MGEKNVTIKRYGSINDKTGIQTNNYDILYPETYEKLVIGKSYFSGILGEERVFSETSVYIVPIKKVIASNGLALTYRQSDGKVVINENGIYIISGRIHMSDQAYGRMQIGIRKNTNIVLAQGFSYGMQMPRNMDGVTNTDTNTNGNGNILNGTNQSFLSVYWVGELNKNDSVYLTYQKYNGGLIRMNRKSGMDIFLLQSDI